MQPFIQVPTLHTHIAAVLSHTTIRKRAWLASTITAMLNCVYALTHPEIPFIGILVGLNLQATNNVTSSILDGQL